jgi:lipopolysaccharide biosynthesis glycosyltransferase
LPQEDMRLLDKLGIKLQMLPKQTNESFAQLVYEKFRVFQMTQYKRVLFLDADILPLTNLDYLFHLSDPEHAKQNGGTALLRPNLFMATRGEPCNTGFFMVEPNESTYKKLEQVIEEHHERAKELPYPHFDWQEGWGHDFIKEGDIWESIHKTGVKWRFHAGHSDQGLLFYFLKYKIQDVSIVIGNKLQNWMPSTNQDSDQPIGEEMIDGLKVHSPEPIASQIKCSSEPGDNREDSHLCLPLYRDIVHFAGSRKPWQNTPPRQRVKGTPSAAQLWFDELSKLNDEYDMGLDIPNWEEKHMPQMKESPLGYLAKYTDHMALVQASNNGTSASPPADITNQDTGGTDGSHTIAYAVSFIKCSDFQTHSAGLIDASLILRHSVHKISKRNPLSGSKYDYKMYAIVHRDAEACSQRLKETGFEVMVVDPPVSQNAIQGDYLRKKIHREWCCGADEFIKLYAYSIIPHEIVVHVDIDFAFYKPMDDLFDAILFDKDSPEGKSARSRLLLERPTEQLPDRIGAFVTRDWPQVAPEKFPPAYQAGFLVARRDPSVFSEITAIIKEGNYTEGWGWKFGWGEKGYGGYVGAMAMQGLVAYYYDYIRPNTAVELNQCRYNHMGMDVLYRKHPNFRRNNPGVGGCRNGLPSCEDCMTTEMDQIYSVHYTMCRKPWQCMAKGAPGGHDPGGSRGSAIDIDTVHLDHCLELVRQWHSLRTDFENQLYDLTQDESIKRLGAPGTYMADIFQGHCEGDGNEHYITLSGLEETFGRIHELYA